MGKLKNYYFEEICNMENYEYDYSYEQQLAEEEAQKQEAAQIAIED